MHRLTLVALLSGVEVTGFIDTWNVTCNGAQTSLDRLKTQTDVCFELFTHGVKNLTTVFAATQKPLYKRVGLHLTTAASSTFTRINQRQRKLSTLTLHIFII